jgi:hypothetical protein
LSKENREVIKITGKKKDTGVEKKKKLLLGSRMTFVSFLDN